MGGLYLICNDGGYYSWLATGDNLLGDGLPEVSPDEMSRGQEHGRSWAYRALSGRSEGLYISHTAI